MNDDYLKDLLERREKFGDLGALDFMIHREKRRLKTELDRSKFSAGITPVSSKEKKVIAQAAEMYRTCGAEYALALLEENKLLNHPFSYLLRANNKLNSDSSWLAGLNAYLQSNKQDPVGLRAGQRSRILRLEGKPKQIVTDGPKVSVIMPAFNAEQTLSLAAESILNQGWRNIELVIIDDCSSDSTWSVCKKLAEQDNRVVILRNSCNVGPYVSKNRALGQTSGEWVTGHDADDWALPDRIATQVNRITSQGNLAEVGHMIRVRVNGEFSHLGRVTSFSPDGCKRLASISTMFRREFLIGRLGAWDSVRFGADSELLARAELACGKPVPRHPDITMICLDEETSLTNHPEFGVSKTSGLSLPRKQYRESWTEWHKTLAPDRVYLAFPHVPRLFDAPVEATVDDESIFGLVSSVPSEKAFSQ